MKSQIREVLIEEKYIKRNGRVYWVYRFNGHGRWNYKLTQYKDIPWVEYEIPNDVEIFNPHLRKRGDVEV